MKSTITLALALLATTAHAATLTATPANVVAQIAAAKPGDVVQLSAGSYGQVNAWNIKQAAPGVTVTPAPGAGVTLTGLTTNGSTNLIFDGINIVGGQVTVQSGGAANQTFRNMKIEGADHTSFVGSCFGIRLAANITVDSSECSWAGVGFSVLDSSAVTITNNVIHDVAVDGIDMAGTTSSKVTGNTATNFHPSAGAHPDFIQWWGTAQTATNNLDIENNHYARGTGGAAQGIFGEDGTNITIKGNTLQGPMYNGIGLARTVGADIEGNFLQSYADMGTRIIVRGSCDQVTINGNTTPAVINLVQAGETPCKTVTIGNNPAMALVGSSGDNAALNAWLAAKGQTVVTAPTQPVDPLQAAVDSLKAQLAALEGQVTASTAQAQAAAAAQAALQAQLGQAQAALAAAQQQLAANAQAFTTIKGAIPGS